MADDGTKIGEGYIEIGTELDLKQLKRSREQVKDHVKRMASAASREWTRQNRDLMGRANNQFQALHKGQTSQVFKRHRAEIKSAQALERQRQRAAAATQKEILAFEKAHAQALLENRKRQEALEKAHQQALIENRRRDDAARKAEIADAKRRMLEIEKAAEAEIRARERAWKHEQDTMKAAKKAHDDYIREQAAKTKALFDQAASPGTGTPKATPGGSGGRPMPGDAGWRAVGNNLNRISDTLGQLSTRIGIAAFQLQMLGVMMHQAITAPVLQGFAQLSTTGLEFAVNIDYARASMKALLGPAVDVEKILNDIKRITVESPLFAADDAIKYAQQLAAAGVAGKDLVPTMQAMSNIFLTQGVAGPERATLAMLAYTQILSKGAIGMDDLRQQFAEHVPGGIKIFEEVARRLGFKTIKLLSEAMKDGDVSAAQLNAEFIKLGNSAKFLEGGANAAQTLGGVWQALKEEVTTEVGTAFDQNRYEIIRAINGIRPVIMTFIGWFVKSLPAAIDVLNRLVTKARDLKDAYDALSPAQQEIIQALGWLTLAAGPAAVALGVLGTGVSTLANAASLLVKVLGLGAGGAGIGALGASALSALGAVIALGSAMVYLYNTSESFRKTFLQVANIIKDIIASVILPMLDYLWMRLQQLGTSLSSLGIETKHLAYLLLALVPPIAAVVQILAVLTVAVEALRFAFMGAYLIADVVLEMVAVILDGVRLILKGLSWLSDTEGPNFLDKWAEGMKDTPQSVRDALDSAEKWNEMWDDKGVDKNRFDGLAEQLKNLDLTTTGVGGAFEGFALALDNATRKEIGLEEAISNARREMELQNSVAANSIAASNTWKQAKAGLTQSIEKNKKTLKDESAAGRENREALRQAAAASYELMLQDIRSGVPMQEAINRHKERAKALVNEFGKSKEVRTEASKLIETYGRVPEDVRTLLTLMGYKDVDGKMIDLLAKQQAARMGSYTHYSAAKAALKKQSRLASGGEVRGPGGPTGDQIPAWLSDREYVIRSASARQLGKPLLDYINEHGQLPAMFAKGGSVEWPYRFDVSKTKIPATLGGPGGGGGLGSARMMQILRAVFPGLPMISGHRPGAITSTGNRSYHAMDRAVDIPPRWDVFNWIRENYGRSTKELIYTPAGSLQIKNGRDHVYSGGTIKQDHYDHIHWAYDNGGLIPPGRVFQNSTNSAELALNAAQGRALEDRIRNSDRPVNVSVYVDGVRRDAEIVWNEKADELARLLGGGL